MIPDSLVFIDGLNDSSILFWMNLATQGAIKFKEVLDFSMRHGNDKTRRLARAFYGPVITNYLSHTEAQVYQAMLACFCFSANFNARIS